jgi:hypothetical protein
LDQQKILELIHKHANNTATEAERDALMAWYHQKDGLDKEYPDTEDAVEDRMLARLMAGMPQRRTNKTAAAAVLFLLGAVSYIACKIAMVPFLKVDYWFSWTTCIRSLPFRKLDEAGRG